MHRPWQYTPHQQASLDLRRHFNNDISFEDADWWLRRTGGNVDEAINRISNYNALSGAETSTDQASMQAKLDRDALMASQVEQRENAAVRNFVKMFPHIPRACVLWIQEEVATKFGEGLRYDLDRCIEFYFDNQEAIERRSAIENANATDPDAALDTVKIGQPETTASKSIQRNSTEAEQAFVEKFVDFTKAPKEVAYEYLDSNKRDVGIAIEDYMSGERDKRLKCKTQNKAGRPKGLKDQGLQGHTPTIEDIDLSLTFMRLED